MQVNPSGTQPYGVRNIPEKTTIARANSGGVEQPVSTDPFVVASQFQQLLSALQQLPDVRPEVIHTVLVNLATGELETPQVVKQTGMAMMRQASHDISSESARE
jgi:hypothetical protein